MYMHELMMTGLVPLDDRFGVQFATFPPWDPRSQLAGQYAAHGNDYSLRTHEALLVLV